MAKDPKDSGSDPDFEPTDPELILPRLMRDPDSLPPPTAAAKTAPVKLPDMGRLDAFMKDPEISEIMVNDLRNVMIEKKGKLIYAGFAFQTLDELNRVVRNILDLSGKFLNPESPYLDLMLADGSRVNIIGPPLTLLGPCITIRKFPTQRLTVDALMTSGTIDRRIAYFLNVCVVARLNILISGGTGSGKTTLLNVLTSFIPKSERIVTIEDTPELSIVHPNSVRIQTKPQSPGSNGILAREMVTNAFRMRPDRIIVGECRRGEAFDVLQAMNTGHLGSMTTLHANSSRDALTKLETLCLMSGVDIPLVAVRKQIQSALDLVIQIKRFRNGKRRVTAITEVCGMEGDTITLQDIFVYDPLVKAAGNQEPGVFKATGFVPTLLDRLKEYGIELPGRYFG